MSSAQSVTLKGRFDMLHGSIESPHLVYETWGERSPDDSNSVLIFTGLSPSAHVASNSEDRSAGWWEDMVGPGKPIDTNLYHVICVNSLGSCFGSTGASSIDPQTGEPYRLTFPVLTVEDIANASARVLDHLGIDRLDTVIGSSMGGMTALAFAMLHPWRTSALVSISSAMRSLPFSIALRSLQREIIRRDPVWNDGNYDLEGDGPITGMRLARKLGMISYRSAVEWTKRFGRERAEGGRIETHAFGIDFEVESYLESHANRFAGSFDANCYLYISRAMDLFDVNDYGGSIHHALAHVKVERAMIVGVETDILFPLSQQQELADGLREHVYDVTYHPLPSIQGHDSFLVDMDRFRPVISDFFHRRHAFSRTSHT